MKNTETKTALAPSYFRRACNSEVARLAQKLSDDFAEAKFAACDNRIKRITEILTTTRSYESICADLNREERGQPEQGEES